MRKIGKILAIFPLLLTSCAERRTPALEDCIQSVEMKSSEFKILQFTDIHYNLGTDLKSTERYLTLLVEEAKPDLIILTGDNFLLGSKGLVKKFFALFESFSIPYAVTWGNHDKEGDYSKRWLSDYCMSLDNCLYLDVDDEVEGQSNYVINIEKDNSTFYQIYCLDTGSNVYMEDTGYVYDTIRDSQVSWYEGEAELAKERNGGEYVPSISYFHIPLWEWVESYFEHGEKREGDIMGFIGETDTYEVKGLTDLEGREAIPFWPGSYHSKFFSSAKERNAKAMFCGHDHSNDYVTSYQGVTLGYGVKSTRELYYYPKDEKLDYDKTGASLVTINEDASYQIKHIYLDFDLAQEDSYLFNYEISEVLR